MASNVRYTSSQLDAIQKDHQNILVSAGAGSGKTAVLSERVIRKLKDGVRIDNLIILTFTNAAAAEMKHRIKSKIEEIPELASQLPHLDNAIISTFDSFALRIVKTYSYLLGIDDFVNISDSVLLNKAKEDAFEEAIKQSYNEPSKIFVDAVELFFEKGDRTFLEGIRTFIHGLERIPNPQEYLSNYLKSYFSDEFLSQSLFELESSLRERTSDISTCLAQFKHEFNFFENEKVFSYFDCLDQFIEKQTNCLDFQEFLKLWKEFRYPTKPTFKSDESLDKDSFKQMHDRLKKDMKAISSNIEDLIHDSSDELKQAVLQTKDTVEAMIDIANKYLLNKNRIFKERALFGFAEIMNLAIDLFETHENIREEYQSRINEIMVDEYQDTNDHQERLLMLLENNNLFMVGDMKQSIYGFRNANPENFYKKYEQYLKHNGCSLIELVENFRSRKEVLSDINTLFSQVMDQRIGGINYHDNQSLIYGNHSYDTLHNDQIQTIAYAYSRNELKQSNPSFNHRIHETLLVIQDIIDKISKGHVILDPKNPKTPKKAEYRDFAILCDRQTSFDLIEDLFNRYQVPLLKVSDDIFSMSTEIQVIHLILRLIRCFEDEMYFSEYFRPSFYGLARSFLYPFEDEGILSYLLTLSGSFKQDLASMEKHDQFHQIFENISNLQKMKSKMCIYDWINELLEKMHFFEKLTDLPDPRSSEMRIDFLVEKIQSAQMFDFDDLSDYFEYVYLSKDMDIEYARHVEFSDNKVKLMTMHKAKGLEFPITYYIGLSNQFNFQENRSFFIFNREYGLISKSYENGFHDTIFHYLAKQHRKTMDISERIRLFYVALTRTKEEMIFILNSDKLDESIPLLNDKGMILDSVRLNYMSYLDLLSSVEDTRRWVHPTPVNLPLPASVDASIIQDILYPVKSFDFFLQEEKEDQFSKKHYGRIDSLTREKMKYGSRVHKALEEFDFQNIDQSIIQTENEIQKIITRFIDHFGKDLFVENDVYQEYEFLDREEGIEYHGIIDLFVEKKDEVILIDYKLKEINDPIYQKQLSGYIRYLKKVTKKPVKAFLFSLLTGDSKEVFENESHS